MSNKVSVPISDHLRDNNKMRINFIKIVSHVHKNLNTQFDFVTIEKYN